MRRATQAPVFGHEVVARVRKLAPGLEELMAIMEELREGRVPKEGQREEEVLDLLRAVTARVGVLEFAEMIKSFRRAWELYARIGHRLSQVEEDVRHKAEQDLKRRKE